MPVTRPVPNPYAALEDEAASFLLSRGVPADLIQLASPPEPEFGELSSNAAFLLAKEYRRSPREIADDMASAFDARKFEFLSRVEAANGFTNFFLDYEAFVPRALIGIEAAGSEFGQVPSAPRRSLLVEHTSVNPNKEWHVGHLRNAVIGDTLVRVARQHGDVVEVQNYIDDTGRQAAEAVLALRLYSAGEDPADEKFDEFVGRYYVRLNLELSEAPAERKVELEQALLSVLHEMEQGLHRGLVERILRAQLETGARIGATYDLLVWESDIVKAQLLDEALAILKRSPRVFVPSEGAYQGALVIELGSHQPDPENREAQVRVLVRSNGIPTYTGKDLPYMMWKFGLLKAQLDICDFEGSPATPVRTSCPSGVPYHPKAPDVVVNVVAEHQGLQQQTVIEGLEAAGYADEAGRVHHLSYGMVSQAAGKISGRKGSGSSADTVMDEAAAVARRRIMEKRPDIPEAEREAIAEAIAVGSIRYLMVQYSPVKPIVFDLEDVVSFEGNTGLYLQYALVRVSSILRRADESGISAVDVAAADLSLLGHHAEHALVLQLARFPQALSDTLRTFSLNIAAEYANILAAKFSQFYRDCPIMSAEPELRLARLRLLRAVQTVLTNAVGVLGIPVVTKL